MAWTPGTQMVSAWYRQLFNREVLNGFFRVIFSIKPTLIAKKLVPQWDLIKDEYGHQLFIADLSAAMAMDRTVKHRTRRQHIGREKMLTGFEHAWTAVLQADFHLTLQNKYPVRCGGDVKLAAKTHRTAAQLQTLRGQQLTQAGLFSALVQRNAFLAKTGAPVVIGE